MTADTTVVRLVDSAGGLDPLTIISLLIGFLGFLFGAYQFFVSRRWKRIEYMDSLIKRFREEPLLVAASVLLDWTIRPVKIGERVVDYRVEMLPHSLADHHRFTDPEKEGFDDDEAAIRDAFDAMLDFLGNIQYAVQLGMIRHKDVFNSPLAYYLLKINEVDRATQSAISRYIKAYGFANAEILLQEYRKRSA